MEMERLRQFAETTTFHGVKDFWRLDGCKAKLLWALFLLTCIGVMFFEMVMVLKQYADNPTATQIIQLYSEEYPYPRMVYCSRRWINESRVAELDLPKPLLAYALSLLQHVRLQPEQNQSGSQLQQLDIELRQRLWMLNFSDYLQLFEAIAYAPGRVVQCNSCSFVHNQVIASGVCLQIRLRPASSAIFIETPPAFRYKQPAENENFSRLVPDYDTTYTTDVLYISYMPQHEFYPYDPILLNRNYSYVLRITPTLHRRLNKAERPCVPSMVARQNGYTQMTCYFRCGETHKTRLKRCQQLDYKNGFVGNASHNATHYGLPFCTTMNPAHRVNQPVYVDQATFNQCATGCQPLCHEWIYETSVLPVVGSKLLSKIDAGDVTIMVSYQVRNGEKCILEVKTYTWDTFLSNIGGQLGLWIGASAISLLQLGHFLTAVAMERLAVLKQNVSAAQNSPHANDVFVYSLTINGLNGSSDHHMQNGNSYGNSAFTRD